MTDGTLLELQGVCKTYPSAAGAAGLGVLRGVDLRVAAGESLAVTGPSGCGKSTLLNIIGALDRPTAGRVLLDGADLAGMGDVELSALRNRRIGLVFQLHHLLPQCSVLENVLAPTLVSRGRALRRQARQRACELLERVGLGGRLDHRPGQLSGGECQRAAVVRALINRPALLLADEPTGSLDRKASQEMAELLVELNAQEGTALVVVTHSDALAALMRRAMELRDGRLAERRPSA